MRASTSIVIAVLSLASPRAVAVAFGHPLRLDAAHAQASELPCVAFWAEARYSAFAYNHIVHLVNACGFPAACTVTTNVNPEPQRVQLATGSQVDVITFMGSPASTFTAAVQCARLARGPDRVPAAIVSSTPRPWGATRADLTVGLERSPDDTADD